MPNHSSQFAQWAQTRVGAMLPRSLTRRCVSRSAPVICARRGRFCPQRCYTLYGTARIFVVFRAAESLRPSFQATAVRRAGAETNILALNRTACPTAEIAEGGESFADRCAPDGSHGPQFVPLPASLARMSQRSARLHICAVLACLASNPRPDLGSIAFMHPSSSISNPTKIAVFCEVLGLGGPKRAKGGQEGAGGDSRCRLSPCAVGVSQRSCVAASPGCASFFSGSAYPPSVPVAGW